MKKEQIIQIEKKANEIRKIIIEMLLNSGSGHPAGSLGMADIFAVLYFLILKHDPQNPAWKERDRLVLSNGHIVPVRYASMYLSGYDITKEELLTTLRKINSRLEGHPSYIKLPGVETSSGPLGEGLSQALGMSLNSRIDGNEDNYNVWCVMSDGEQDEGMVWEAVMACGKYKPKNLITIIDRNNIQIDGYTEDVMPVDPLALKYKAFGWKVFEIDGHNIEEVIDTLNMVKDIKEGPVCVIAKTIPGKGVSFMENDYSWHGRAPNFEESKLALEELENNKF